VQSRNYAGYVRSIAAAGVAAACLAAAACGSGGGDPLANTPAKTIVTEAFDNLKAAPSVTMVGTITQSGTNMNVNLGYKKGTGCTGTISLGSKGTLTLVVVGSTAYLKMDDTFLKAVAGSEASAAIALIDGRYLKAATSDSNVASFANLCNLNSLVSSLNSSNSDTFTKGTVTTLNGQQVLPITDKTHGGTLYVTDTSSPQVVQISNTSGSSGATGKLVFDVGATVNPTAPPANQTIDGSSLGF
jgi:hypothetical protein